MSKGSLVGLGCLGVVLIVALVLGLSGIGQYNTLVELSQAVDAQWSQAVSRNPFLGLRVKGAKVGDRISVTWVDNQGDRRIDEAVVAAAS